MSTVKERYEQARSLAKAGAYSEALVILETIDHSKARELENQIYERAESEAPTTMWNTRRVIALVIGMVFLVGIGYLTVYALQQQREQAIYAAVRDACWDAHRTEIDLPDFDYCEVAVESLLDTNGDIIHSCYNQHGAGGTFVWCMENNDVRL